MSQDSEIQFDDSAGTFYLREAASAHEAYPLGYNPATHPVQEVTWYGAARFCDWLSMRRNLPRAYEHLGDWSCHGGNPYSAPGYRLPTDAEWEYAAQFDDERLYPWGNESPGCGRANHSRPEYLCVGWTASVGCYPDAPAALRLSDMAGNLWEWVNDWCVCALGYDPVVDPPGPDSGHGRVIRGGAWNYCAVNLCCALRWDGHVPEICRSDIGFRVAKTHSP